MRGFYFLLLVWLLVSTAVRRGLAIAQRSYAAAHDWLRHDFTAAWAAASAWTWFTGAEIIGRPSSQARHRRGRPTRRLELAMAEVPSLDSGQRPALASRLTAAHPRDHQSLLR